MQTLQKDTVNFSGSASYATFRRKFKDAKLTEAELLNICLRKNEIGAGSEGLVFEIPIQGFEDYVIKILRHTQISGLEKLKQEKDQAPRQNLGQAIAKIGDRIQVLKRLKGTASLEKIYSADKGKYYEQMAQLPQSSYNSYAEQVKLANKKGYFFDGGNAGNIILDGNNLKITDLWKRPSENALGDLLLPIIAGYQEIKSGNILNNAETVMKKIFHSAKKAKFYTGMGDEAAMYFRLNATEPMKKIFDGLLDDYWS